MTLLENSLIILSTLVLAIGFGLSVRSLLAPLHEGLKRALVFNGIGFVLLAGAFAVDLAARPELPLSTMRASMLLFGLILLAVSSVMTYAAGSLLLSVLSAPVVILLQLLSLFFDRWPASEAGMQTFGATITTIHIALFLVSYAFLIIAAGFSAMFLVMDHLLKEKAYSPVFFKLPGLTRLDTYAYWSALAGLGVLTGGIALALVSARAASAVVPAPLGFDFTIIGTLVVWAYYAAYVLMRIRLRIPARRAALVGVCGLAIVLAVYFFSKMWGPTGIHGFGVTERASAGAPR